MTSLTVNGSAVAATTLATAGKLFNATGGTSGNTSTKVGSGTLNKQIFAKGTTTNQTGVSSIPAPTDSNFSGWMWDVDTLAGQVLLAGTLTPTFHLLASTGTTVTPTVQWFKRTSAGVWSQLATVAGSSIALTTSSQALTFTPPSMSDTSFATGDRFCCWLWVNQTAGGATNSTISVVEATSGSSAGVASEVQTVTPGYAPSTNTDASVLRTRVRTQSLASTYATVVQADSPIRAYRLGEAAGTVASDLGSQGQNGTISATGVTLGQKGLVNDPDGAMLFASASSGVITLPTTGLPTGSASWSMEAWVSMPLLPTVYRPILDLGGGYAVLYAASTNKFAIDVHAIVDLQANVTFTTATTYHVVATYDGNNLTLYVNGAQVATQAIGAINITYGTASIGYDGVNYWNGTTDEVRIYGAVLSLARVQAHHTAGVLAGIIPVTGVRLPVRTQVTKSAVLRVVVATTTLATKIAVLRTKVRTQVTKASSLRTLVRTQVTKALGLRALIRTQKTVSSPLRTVVKGITDWTRLRISVRTQKTGSTSIRADVRTQSTPSIGALRTLVRAVRSRSTGIRALVRTQVARSVPFRTVVRGITTLVIVRTVVRTLNTATVPLRTKVRSQVTGSVVFRVVARMTQSVSSTLRAVIASLVIKTAPLRVRVRSQRTVMTSLLAVIATKAAQSAPLRVTLRGVTKGVGLRLRARTPQKATTLLRVVARTLENLSSTLRVAVASRVSRLSQLRTVVRGITTLAPLRVVTRGITRIVSLRTNVATLHTVSHPLRTRVSTAYSLVTGLLARVRSLVSTSFPLRVPVRSLSTLSSAFRVPIRTVRSLGAPLRVVTSALGQIATRFAGVRLMVSTGRSLITQVRVLVRSQIVHSAPLRAIVRGITNVATLRLVTRIQKNLLLVVRVPIRSARSLLSVLRVRVASLRMVTAMVRVVASTRHSLSTSLRVPLRSLSSPVASFRTRVRSQISRLTTLRAQVASRVVGAVPVRIVARGRSYLVELRVWVETSRSQVVPMRLLAATRHRRSLQVRLALRSTVTQSVALLALVQTTVQKHMRLRVPISTGRNALVSFFAPVRSLVASVQVLRLRVASTRARVAGVRALVKSLGQARPLVVRARIATRTAPLVGLRTITTIPGVRGSIDPPLGSSPATYQGHTVVPTRPSGVYVVNGVILDSQPTVCTAPLETHGVRFLAGSTFSLFFDRPTTLTQTLLTNGQTVSMTFALANGQMVTGYVQVTSTLVAATSSLSVLCTLVSADVALAL